MGRKDAARFKKIEDRVRWLEIHLDETTERLGKIIEKRGQELIQLRDLLTRLIEGG